MKSLIVILAFLMTATSALAAQATATRLDGTTVVGELTSWQGQALELSTKSGPVQLSAADVLSLRWSPPVPLPGDSAGATRLQPAVELSDGTILPIEDLRRQAGNVVVSLRGTSPNRPDSIELPDRAVSAARLQPLQDATAQQWEEIRSEGVPSDVLVLLKRGGQSVDYVEGTIGDVSGERIEFKLEEDMRRVERSKVAGVIFYRAKRPLEKEPVCIVRGRDGLRASVAAVSLRDGVVRMTTVAGVEFGWPLTEIQSADFSAGKVVFLSDLKPALEEYTPLVGSPRGASLASAYGRPHRDKSAFGGPLTVWIPGADSLAPAGHAQSYARGLAVRSRTALEYRVPRGFTRLLGVAGIDPAMRASGLARLTITGDERSLLDSELGGDKSPLELELDITGVKRLKIVVDYGPNLDTGDWVNLCDVRIVK